VVIANYSIAIIIVHSIVSTIILAIAIILIINHENFVAFKSKFR